LFFEVDFTLFSHFILLMVISALVHPQEKSKDEQPAPALQSGHPAAVGHLRRYRLASWEDRRLVLCHHCPSTLALIKEMKDHASALVSQISFNLTNFISSY
jgi:hypothetical protein